MFSHFNTMLELNGQTDGKTVVADNSPYVVYTWTQWLTQGGLWYPLSQVEMLNVK